MNFEVDRALFLIGLGVYNQDAISRQLAAAKARIAELEPKPEAGTENAGQLNK